MKTKLEELLYPVGTELCHKHSDARIRIVRLVPLRRHTFNRWFLQYVFVYIDQRTGKALKGRRYMEDWYLENEYWVPP